MHGVLTHTRTCSGGERLERGDHLERPGVPRVERDCTNAHPSCRALSDSIARKDNGDCAVITKRAVTMRENDQCGRIRGSRRCAVVAVSFSWSRSDYSPARTRAVMRGSAERGELCGVRKNDVRGGGRLHGRSEQSAVGMNVGRRGTSSFGGRSHSDRYRGMPFSPLKAREDPKPCSSRRGRELLRLCDQRLLANVSMNLDSLMYPACDGGAVQHSRQYWPRIQMGCRALTKRQREAKGDLVAIEQASWWRDSGVIRQFSLRVQPLLPRAQSHYARRTRQPRFPREI